MAIPHYAVLSNVLQMATFNRVADPTYNVPWDKKRFRAGDVVAGGSSTWYSVIHHDCYFELNDIFV